MNQELSRVQTYGTRRNGRKGKEDNSPNRFAPVLHGPHRNWLTLLLHRKLL